MPYNAPSPSFQIAQWHFDSASGELDDGVQQLRLEPKAADLLKLLASSPDQLLSRQELIEQVWSDTIVGEDALARAIFKLRRALGDDPKSSHFIETIPKRGYRMIAPVVRLEAESAAADVIPVLSRRRWSIWALAGLALAAIVAAMLGWHPNSGPEPAPDSESAALVDRAQDFYYRYSRADNEAAVELFDRILAREPDKVDALAGLANALVQRSIRWPELGDGRPAEFGSLSEALANGHLQQPQFQRTLERAELLARRALELQPDDPLLHRSLGLVLAAQARPDLAIEQYREAIRLDADAWGAMINLGEMLQLQGQPAESLAMFVNAHEAMTRRYDADRQHVSLWYTELAVLIGDRMQAQGRSAEAESWYRRALLHAPLNPAATAALAGLLESSGRGGEATQLCAELNERVGSTIACPRSSDNP